MFKFQFLLQEYIVDIFLTCGLIIDLQAEGGAGFSNLNHSSLVSCIRSIFLAPILNIKQVNAFLWQMAMAGYLVVLVQVLRNSGGLGG